MNTNSANPSAMCVCVEWRVCVTGFVVASNIGAIQSPCCCLTTLTACLATCMVARIVLLSLWKKYGVWKWVCGALGELLSAVWAGCVHHLLCVWFQAVDIVTKLCRCKHIHANVDKGKSKKRQTLVWETTPTQRSHFSITSFRTPHTGQHVSTCPNMLRLSNKTSANTALGRGTTIYKHILGARSPSNARSSSVFGCSVPLKLTVCVCRGELQMFEHGCVCPRQATTRVYEIQATTAKCEMTDLCCTERMVSLSHWGSCCWLMDARWRRGPFQTLTHVIDYSTTSY